MKYKKAFKSVLSVKLKYINLYNNADLSGEKNTYFVPCKPVE